MEVMGSWVPPTALFDFVVLFVFLPLVLLLLLLLPLVFLLLFNFTQTKNGGDGQGKKRTLWLWCLTLLLLISLPLVLLLMLLNFHINYFTEFRNGRDGRLRGQRGLGGCVTWRGRRGGGTYEVMNKRIYIAEYMGVWNDQYEHMRWCRA